MPTASRAPRFSFSYRDRTARLQHLAGLGVGAVLLALCYPDPGWWWLAWIALTPFAIAAARTHRPRRLAWTSMLVFTLWWAWMCRFLMPVTGPGVWGLAAVLGLMTAGAMWGMAVIHRKLNWPMVLVFPLGWMTLEVVRSQLPVGGFSWFSLAQSQAAWRAGDVSRVLQVSDLLGLSTASLVIATVNGALADVLMARRLPRGPVAAAGLLLVASLGYGHWRLSPRGAEAGPGAGAKVAASVRVGVVQTNVSQENKNLPTLEAMAADFETLVSLHREAASGAGAERPDVIVWPETVVPAPLNTSGLAAFGRVANDPEVLPATQQLYAVRSQAGELTPRLIEEAGVPTLAGASWIDFVRRADGTTDRQHFNSAFLFDAAGGQRGPAYHKQHLVPLGETIPGPAFLKSLVLWMSPYGPENDYTIDAGEGPVTMVLPGGLPVATPICYEDAVGRVCRRMVYGPEGKRVSLLLNLTNNGWYPGRAMRRQHLQLATLRTIENRVPMVRSVNTGLSAWIDSDGRVLRTLPMFSAEAGSFAVTLDERTTGYGRIGGWPWTLWVLLSVGSVLAGLVFGRPEARNRIA